MLLKAARSESVALRQTSHKLTRQPPPGCALLVTQRAMNPRNPSKLAIRAKPAPSQGNGAAPSPSRGLETELLNALNQIDSQQQRIRLLDEQLYKLRERLTAVETRNQQLFSTASVGYLDLNRLGSIEAVNPAAAELLQRDPQLLIGKPFSIFLRGQDHLRFSEHLALCQSRNEKHTTQLLLHIKDSPPLPVYLSSVPAQEGNSWIFRTVLADNSAHANLAADHSEQLSREQSARREAERDRDFISQVLSHAPVMIGALEGPDLLVKWLNSAAAIALGGDSSALLNRPLFELIPETGEPMSSLFEQLQHTRKAVSVPETQLTLA